MATPRDPDAVEREDRLDESFFRGQARQIARDLVGTLLLADSPAGPVGGIVVETEAYVNAVDPACHLAAGRTPRTDSFFGGPGTVYVYAIHGHAALNLITEFEGHPEGILLRAIEPTHGRAVMRERRGFEDPTKLASGPGRLTEALGVTRQAYDDRPLAETDLRLSRTDLDSEIAVSRRVGVSDAADWPLRFVAADSEFTSAPVRDADLDYEAVERAYAVLEETSADRLPTPDALAERDP